MENRIYQLESGELPVAQPSLSGQQQTNKDHSRLRSAASHSRSPDRHGGSLSSGLSYVPRPRELDWRREDYYRGESSSPDLHYYYSDELREPIRGDHYGGRRESSRDDYYERRREASRGGDRYDGRRESSLDDYYGRRREPRRDDSYKDRREPRLASTSSSLMPTSIPFTSNAAAAVAAVATAPMATANTTITTAPQPAPTRGMFSSFCFYKSNHQINNNGKHKSLMNHVYRYDWHESYSFGDSKSTKNAHRAWYSNAIKNNNNSSSSSSNKNNNSSSSK
ncbi:hypothetical protein BDB00DRAFT_415820 [Zychaea mexicana]|uniref:uncharacterized protein n=1 Tax=Zychaea mexicana TaxID=64656 RepID=UPI0022FEF937|nr:uncharacterized protein BDB00DRAFT_415820 [Zychaea mexicana]KAI9492769.1 hypothetical protein BDB00DRAFT_415820 [Zychaea mexicana]